MELSNEPTNHLLLRAWTNSEWDSCDFAIIHATNAWKKEIQKRFSAAKPFSEDSNFQSLNYYDAAVNFHVVDQDDVPNVDKLLSEKGIVFVQLEEAESEELLVPESRLDCHNLEVFSTGTARFTAYGKHTGEQFWTDEFPLNLVIESCKGE